MNPGTSFSTRTGVLPTWASSTMVASIATSVVASVRMTSTSGIRCGGFHQCVPRARVLFLRPDMISVIGMTEVFEHSIAPVGAAASTSAKIACFRGIFSGAASNTKSARSTASGTVAATAIRARVSTASVAPISRRLSATRACKADRASATGSVTTTECPARAIVRAIPCSINPAPITAIRMPYPAV